MFPFVCSNFFRLFAFLNPACGFHPVLELGKQGELQGILEPGGSVNTCYLLSRQTSGLRDGWWDEVPDLKELYRKETGQMKLQPQQLPSPALPSLLPHTITSHISGRYVEGCLCSLMQACFRVGWAVDEGSQELRAWSDHMWHCDLQ